VSEPKLQVIPRGPIRELRLHRPEVRNAFDDELIAALDAAFRTIASEVASGSPANRLRGVLLTGEGETFCAGADLNYMRKIAGYGEEENREDARRMSAMFQTIRSCPLFVVGRVQGAALGGGTGLVACCDLTIASERAIFGFTEVRLGIVPAVISPFVLDRIGPAHARALFPTGARFPAAEALRIGLVDRVVPEEQLDAAAEDALGALLAAGPQASREAKRLVGQVTAGAGPGQAPPSTSTHEEMARLIARLRSSPEGREGITAFLEKRRPSWVNPPPQISGDRDDGA
jgi:methylglutaconyl-CoA hydratase